MQFHENAAVVSLLLRCHIGLLNAKIRGLKDMIFIINFIKIVNYYLQFS
jgi:hypothetical protein